MKIHMLIFYTSRLFIFFFHLLVEHLIESPPADLISKCQLELQLVGFGYKCEAVDLLRMKMFCFRTLWEKHTYS